jgi:hypothetical protein
MRTVSTKYRDLYKAKVKGAVPVTDEEQDLLRRALEEEKEESLAIAVAEQLEARKRKPGAPRKVGGDLELARQLMAKNADDENAARNDFIRVMGEQGQCEPKRARARFKAALGRIKGT